MEDSPLVSSNNNNNTNLNTVSQNNPNVLMVIPNVPSSDCPSSVLSHSSSSSSSSSGSSSCGSCYNTYMPKSNSNPMLLSAGSLSSSASSSSSTHALSTSPASTSSLQSKKPSECGCSNTTSSNNLKKNHQYQAPKSNSVLDLFIKKSNQDAIENSSSYDQYSQNTGSLITTANSMNSLLTNVSQNNSGYQAIETAAKKYRCAAQVSEATCCWKGKLPPKQYKTPIVYSTKVFVGGLPWDISEDDLIKEFGVFGSCRVEWTNKEKFNMMGNHIQIQQNDMPFDQNNSTNNNNSYNSMRNTRSMSNQICSKIYQTQMLVVMIH